MQPLFNPLNQFTRSAYQTNPLGLPLVGPKSKYFEKVKKKWGLDKVVLEEIQNGHLLHWPLEPLGKSTSEDTKWKT